MMIPAIPAGYQLGACFEGGIDLAAAGSAVGVSVNPMQGQIIGQIMSQYYHGDKARNMLMIQILSECAAVMSAPGLDADKSHCKQAWPQCAKQLQRNAQTMGVDVPEWLTAAPPTKGWGSDKVEL
jgi:hypothetical protein